MNTTVYQNYVLFPSWIVRKIRRFCQKVRILQSGLIGECRTEGTSGTNRTAFSLPATAQGVDKGRKVKQRSIVPPLRSLV
jgi:hypothetical protein